MQKLMQTRLFRLLSEASQYEVSTSQLEESHDEFALKVLTRIQLEDKPQELYFSLGFVHIKLAGIRERLSGGQEKKCPENRVQNHVCGSIGYAGIGMANYSTNKPNQVFL